MNLDDFTEAEYVAASDMLASFGLVFSATKEEIEHIAERIRQIEYDEYIVKYPKNLTSEDLSANHAAGLPITAERVVRCVNCRWFQENVTPHDSERPHFCALNGFDMGDAYGFCAWGEQS